MKNLKQTFKIIILGLIFSAGLAWAFTAPTASYPNGNTDEPIHVGIADQIKIGGLSLGGPLLVTAGNTDFYGGVKIGSSANPYNLYSKGDVGVGIYPSAKLDILGNVKMASLAHGTSTSDPSRICADVNGLMSLCPTGSLSLSPTSTISGASCGSMPNGCTWTVPDGVYKMHIVLKGGNAGDTVVKDFVINPFQAVKMTIGSTTATDLYVNNQSYAHSNAGTGAGAGSVSITW